MRRISITWRVERPRLLLATWTELPENMKAAACGDGQGLGFVYLGTVAVYFLRHAICLAEFLKVICIFRITGENDVVGWLALLFHGSPLTSVKRIRLAS